MGTNDNLLELFRKRAKVKRDKMNDVDRARFLLQFNTIEGNINCISHGYNLAVHAGLTALNQKASDMPMSRVAMARYQSKSRNRLRV